MRARQFVTAAALALSLTGVASATAQTGQILVDFFAVPGTGFADPTPVAPVGGNPGVTLGEQRIRVFLRAAEIWTETIKPEQDIYVAAQFTALGPGVLGSAGAGFIWANFPNAELQNTWYFDSLADHLSKQDLSPTTYDVYANFSTAYPFYLGFDNNEPPGTSDLLVVVLHEIGHGLNFANAVNESNGAIPTPQGATGPFGDIYSQYTQDVTTGKVWNEMTDAERAASAINIRKVSWSGLNVKRNQHRVLERGEPVGRVLSPASLGTLMIGEASFGPQLTATGTTGNVVEALDDADPAGPLTSDGCSPILNDLTGRIALIDRGTCAFTVKVLNAQNAGAIAVLIADNVVNLPPPGLGGADPAVTIPSVRIGLPEATAIRASLAAGVRIRLHRDLTVVAGTDRVKRQVMLAALNPVSPGSSISHLEAVASPNQIMEPAINGDLVSSLKPPEDLTTPLLTDLGWFTDRDGVQDGVDLCLGSNTQPTVLVGQCDSGAANVVGQSGCSVADLVGACAALPHRGLYRACVVVAALGLRHAGTISAADQNAIARCALRP
jgi:hypothetical protein